MFNHFGFLWNNQSNSSTVNSSTVKAVPTQEMEQIKAVPAQESEQIKEQIKVEQEINGIARLAYEQLDPLPEKFRKSVIDRLIAIHNADAELEPNKILLREGGEANYPKLNQWIENKLNFFKSKRSIANFAFACGHFADFLEARDNFPSNIHKLKCEFFRKYFQKKGTANGVKDLSRIISTLKEYNVSEVPHLDQLEKAKYGMNVEVVNGLPSSNDQFDYMAALSVVNKIPSSRASSLANNIGFDYTEFQNILSENNSDQSLTFMVLFHLATTHRNLTNKSLVQAFNDSQLGLLGCEVQGYQESKVASGNKCS